ncbi:hypothetical protein GH733_016177 [Mirounga leonina]|nr:hypothetical protein GH733_016177 [Mirounga leonina]
MLAREVPLTPGTISSVHAREVGPDLCFHRDPDEVAVDEQAAAKKTATQEGFQSGLLQLRTEFTATQPEITDLSKTRGYALCLVSSSLLKTQPATEDWSAGSHCLGH